jgi:hypothetical protein
MLRAWPMVLSLVLASLPRTASAETRATAPAGGGLPALDVTVDLATGSVSAGTTRIPVGLDRAQFPAEKDVVVESVAIGAGRHLIHVSVPVKDAEGLAWEVLLAPGKGAPLFAGLTGFTTGDPGERTGKAIRIVPQDDTSFVLVGDIREDLRVCGQAWTQLDPQAVYPASLDLRPATVQRLSAGQQASAQRIVAADAGASLAPSLAKLLVARGSSVPGSRGVELTDGDPSTTWSERRPRIGQGEFVTMSAPRDVPIARMQVVVTPPEPSPDGASPRTFYLVTDTSTFEVTLPGDAWLKPGEAFEIVFPRPLEASCVSLVLGDAYARGLAHPDVGVAELVAYSEFDGPGVTLETVAKKLTGDRGVAAAQVLERAGASALAATQSVYGELDERGRALAIDVAASHEQCVEAAPLLARGLCEARGQAPRKAREKLERCKGASATLAATMRQDPSSRACIAPTLAAIGAADALEPLADAMAASGDAEIRTRAVLRGAFSLALHAASPERLAALIADPRRGPRGRLEILRAAGPRVAETPAESAHALSDILAGAPTPRVRYLALSPIGELAHAGDTAASSLLAGSIGHDPDWPVRARAAELGAGVAVARLPLLAAARDAEPRVREAALQALAASPPPESFDVARVVLRGDGWSFVKAQAVAVLAKAPASPQIDESLRDAMNDPAVRVRAMALNAVALRHTRALHGAVRERLDDPREEAEVRAAAAAAVGAVCDDSSADRLTELARRLGAPGSEEDQQVALGALVGLAALHPSDLAKRLAPLMAPSTPPYVRTAAEKALAARSTCR